MYNVYVRTVFVASSAFVCVMMCVVGCVLCCVRPMMACSVQSADPNVQTSSHETTARACCNACLSPSILLYK